MVVLVRTFTRPSSTDGERLSPHTNDAYSQPSRRIAARHSHRIIADTKRPLALYEPGFAPRRYVPRADVDESELTPVEPQTFCPYRGLCSYYDIGDAHLAVWSYRQAIPRLDEFLT